MECTSRTPFLFAFPLQRAGEKAIQPQTHQAKQLPPHLEVSEEAPCKRDIVPANALEGGYVDSVFPAAETRAGPLTVTHASRPQESAKEGPVFQPLSPIQSTRLGPRGPRYPAHCAEAHSQQQCSRCHRKGNCRRSVLALWCWEGVHPSPCPCHFTSA